MADRNGRTDLEHPLFLAFLVSLQQSPWAVLLWGWNRSVRVGGNWLRWIVVVVNVSFPVIALECENWHSHEARRGTFIALMSTASSYVGWFSAAHFDISTRHPASYSEPLSRLDSVYFTVSTMTTTGFGDITPRSSAARAVCLAQMASGFLLLGIVAALLVSRWVSTWGETS